MKQTKPTTRGKRPKAVRPTGGMRAWRADLNAKRVDKPERSNSGDPAGLAARRLAVDLIEAVLVSSRAIDDALDAIDQKGRYRDLEPRDRGFARLIAATVLRRLGTLDAVLARFIERPIPVSQPRPRSILPL